MGEGGGLPQEKLQLSWSALAPGFWDTVIVAMLEPVPLVVVRHLTPAAVAEPHLATTLPSALDDVQVIRTPSLVVPEELLGASPTPVDR